MTDYKPGAVAMVRLKGDQCLTQRAWLDSLGCWQFADGYSAHSSRPDLIADVRPLVVLDPEDRETARRFAENAADGDAAEWRVNNWQNFLRSLIKPPKPAEPLGLGAVVEDAEGVRWLRSHGVAGCVWHDGTPNAARTAYSRITAVRILSDGVIA